MGQEIERKFLVRSDAWRAEADNGKRYRQGYLGRNPTVRVRLEGDDGKLTIKGARRGAARPEYEYDIPAKDAEAMFALCTGSIVDKTRYRVLVSDHVWEVDVFHGDNDGLVVAEIELSEVGESFETPDWAGDDVTDEGRYYNVVLSQQPYRTWPPSAKPVSSERADSE